MLSVHTAIEAITFRATLLKKRNSYYKWTINNAHLAHDREAGRGPVHSGSVAAEDHQEAGQGGGGGGRTPGEDGLHVDPHQVRNNPSGPLLAELDAPPEKMLSLWSPTRGAGEVDVVFVVEESESMKPGITALTRVLGGGGGNSEVKFYKNIGMLFFSKYPSRTVGEKKNKYYRREGEMKCNAMCRFTQPVVWALGGEFPPLTLGHACLSSRRLRCRTQAEAACVS
eukprot:1193378-Prorocentrum_minimum.AAC.3